MIPSRVKRRCLDAWAQGMSNREIYEQIFVPGMDGEPVCNPAAFARALRKWRRNYAPPETLDAGTYPGFTAHGATVQVDAAGNITQAWIKQHTEVDWQEIAAMLTAGVEPLNLEPCTADGESMLEIPLFDMHFGIASNYFPQLRELLGIITVKTYDEINVLFGQDMLHTNDMRGHTAKGTDIDQIDFREAWKDAWQFWEEVLTACVEHGKKVKVWYSKGNHDECTAWCLFKALQVRFPMCEWDDTILPRKCLLWHGCFIGFGHCEYTGQSGKIFQNFVTEFPYPFAAAKVREVHTGHLHRESIDDGIMVRRLSTAVPSTEWEKNQGFTGAQKRFQIFEWMPERLKAIYYI